MPVCRRSAARRCSARRVSSDTLRGSGATASAGLAAWAVNANEVLGDESDDSGGVVGWVVGDAALPGVAGEPPAKLKSRGGAGSAGHAALLGQVGLNSSDDGRSGHWGACAAYAWAGPVEPASGCPGL